METRVVACDTADDSAARAHARVLDDFGRHASKSRSLKFGSTIRIGKTRRRRLDPLVDTSRDLVRCYPSL